MKIITKMVFAFAFSILGFLSAQEPEIKDAPRATGYKRPTQEQRHAVYARDRVRNGSRVAMAAKMSALPAQFDCWALGWVPPIEDQGSCGDCYGVATADQLTCAFVKAGYQKNDGSFAIRFQFGLDCHSSFGGCNGGWGYEVAEWMKENGFPAEYYVDASGKKIVDYPAYEARPRTCRERSGAKRWKPAEIGLCSGSANRAATVAEIKTCLMQYGVVNIAFNATSAYGNAGKNVVTVRGGANHETTLVGWDDAKNNGKGAWKSRGNWGTSLGDGGYVWMSYDSELEDPFWMTATPLPPPPEPIPPEPTPPGPGPGPSPTVTLLTIDRFLQPGTYRVVPRDSEVMPAGTAKKLKDAMDRLKEIEKLLESGNDIQSKKIEPMDVETKEPPPIESKKPVNTFDYAKEIEAIRDIQRRYDELSPVAQFPPAKATKPVDPEPPMADEPEKPRAKFDPYAVERDPKTGKVVTTRPMPSPPAVDRFIVVDDLMPVTPRLTKGRRR